EKISHV
ncbi:hypothetical protein NPIL_479581, partial [Nephila pilipes]